MLSASRRKQRDDGKQSDLDMQAPGDEVHVSIRDKLFTMKYQ